MSKLTKEQKQMLAELAHSGQGKVLKMFIAECLEELGDVSKCTSWEDTLGRRHAKEFILKSFSFLDKPENPPSKRTNYS